MAGGKVVFSGTGEYKVTVDLGTTNIKTGVFDSSLKELTVSSSEVRYHRSGNIVEFDPDEYWEVCRKQIRAAIDSAGIEPRRVRSLSLTGQAESLVLMDDRLGPLRMGISWMDNRSQRECENLRSIWRGPSWRVLPFCLKRTSTPSSGSAAD